MIPGTINGTIVCFIVLQTSKAFYIIPLCITPGHLRPRFPTEGSSYRCTFELLGNKISSI